MINANEAKAITSESHTHKLAKEFCDGTMSKMIEESAKMGWSHVTFRVPEELLPTQRFIFEELRTAGYSLDERRSGLYIVRWEEG